MLCRSLAALNRPGSRLAPGGRATTCCALLQTPSKAGPAAPAALLGRPSERPRTAWSPSARCGRGACQVVCPGCCPICRVPMILSVLACLTGAQKHCLSCQQGVAVTKGCLCVEGCPPQGTLQLAGPSWQRRQAAFSALLPHRRSGMVQPSAAAAPVAAPPRRCGGAP